MGFASEKEIAEALAIYMQRMHPDLIYRFDLAADLRLTAGQARRHKKIHPVRGYPDLFIARAPGLFLELKKDGTRLKKKNGDWATPHLKEQAAVLERLRTVGYCADFAIGLDEAIKIIEIYLKGGKIEN